MQPWKTRSRRTILDYGKFLRVEEHVVELPDGRVINNWSWVVTPDYVNVLVVREDGKILCFKQTKYAVEGTTMAVVGGYMEPDEDPLTAIKRELLEETGYEAPTWTTLGSYAVDANRGAGTGYAFLAEGAREVAEIDADDLEEQELLALTMEEVEAALLAGEFKVMPWTTTVALALLQLKGRRS
jgi:ADP-ribose pyrophosphatase